MSTLAKVVYWIVGIGMGVNIIMLVWFTIGGVFDCIYLLQELKAEMIDEADDGRVDKTL